MQTKKELQAENSMIFEDNLKLSGEIQECRETMNALIEQNHEYEQNAHKYQDKIKQLRVKVDCQASENRSLVSDSDLANKEIKELKNELSSLKDTKIVLAELKSCISAPNVAIENKVHDLEECNRQLKDKVKEQEYCINNLENELRDGIYLKGKVEAYEKMILPNKMSRHEKAENPECGFYSYTPLDGTPV